MTAPASAAPAMLSSLTARDALTLILAPPASQTSTFYTLETKLFAAHAMMPLVIEPALPTAWANVYPAAAQSTSASSALRTAQFVLNANMASTYMIVTEAANTPSVSIALNPQCTLYKDLLTQALESASLAAQLSRTATCVVVTPIAVQNAKQDTSSSLATMTIIMINAFSAIALKNLLKIEDLATVLASANAAIPFCPSARSATETKRNALSAKMTSPDTIVMLLESTGTACNAHPTCSSSKRAPAIDASLKHRTPSVLSVLTKRPVIDADRVTSFLQTTLASQL